MVWLLAGAALLIAIPWIVVARRDRRRLPTHADGHRNEYVPGNDPKGVAKFGDIFRGGSSGGG